MELTQKLNPSSDNASSVARLTKYHFSLLYTIIRKGRNDPLISFSFSIFLIPWLRKQKLMTLEFFFQNSGRYSFNSGSICDSLYRTLQGSVSQTFLLAEPFWLRKITTDPHILAYVNSYLRNEFRYLRIHTSSISKKYCMI
jgi:hypothetical protein